jgi:hypothetical protein
VRNRVVGRDCAEGRAADMIEVYALVSWLLYDYSKQLAGYSKALGGFRTAGAEVLIPHLRCGGL